MGILKNVERVFRKWIGHRKMIKNEVCPALYDLRLRIAHAVLKEADLKEIRSHSLSNLTLWRTMDRWTDLHEKWHDMIISFSDLQIVLVMTSANANADRLRSSPPYVGIIDRETRHRLLEKYESDRVNPTKATDPQRGHFIFVPASRNSR